MAEHLRENKKSDAHCNAGKVDIDVLAVLSLVGYGATSTDTPGTSTPYVIYLNDSARENEGR